LTSHRARQRSRAPRAWVPCSHGRDDRWPRQHSPAPVSASARRAYRSGCSASPRAICTTTFGASCGRQPAANRQQPAGSAWNSAYRTIPTRGRMPRVYPRGLPFAGLIAAPTDPSPRRRRADRRFAAPGLSMRAGRCGIHQRSIGARKVSGLLLLAERRVRRLILIDWCY
jgi:hypothetical protein